jgi:hypothetical protein
MLCNDFASSQRCAGQQQPFSNSKELKLNSQKGTKKQLILLPCKLYLSLYFNITFFCSIDYPNEMRPSRVWHEI